MSLPSLGATLFSATQQKVLGLLYGKPDQSFYANEIVRWASLGKGSVMRELERLLSVGILTMVRQGNQTRYQANPDSPIYSELLGIVRKTFGIGEQIRLALQPLEGQLAWAFIYGSIAKGGAHARSDVDLMIIGSDLNYAEVMEHLMPVEEAIGRAINPTLSTVEDWVSKKALGNSFAVRITQQEKINLMGHDPSKVQDGSE